MSKPIDITIRPIRREDAQAFNEIRRTYSVMRNTLALMSDRVDKTEAMLASQRWKIWRCLYYGKI